MNPQNNDANYSAYIGLAGSHYFSEHFPEDYFHAADSLFNALRTPPNDTEAFYYNGEGIINSQNLQNLVNYIVDIRKQMSENSFYIKSAICKEDEPLDIKLVNKTNFKGLKLRKGYHLRSLVRQGKFKGIGVYIDNVLNEMNEDGIIYNNNYYLNPSRPSRIVHFYDIPLSSEERSKNSLNNFLRSFSLSTHISPKLSRFHISYLANWILSIDFNQPKLQTEDENFLRFIVDRSLFDRSFRDVTRKDLIYYTLLNQIHKHRNIHLQTYKDLYALIGSKKAYVNELRDCGDTRIISDEVKESFLREISERSHAALLGL